jgi:hypothetical protein
MMDKQDEMIAAYLDGTLPDEELNTFEAEMDANPALAAEVLRLQRNDSLLRAAYDAPIAQGVDDALLARLGLGAQVVEFSAKEWAKPAAANDNILRRYWPVGGVIAASLLAFALITSPFASPADPTRSEAFQAAMQTTPSRTVASLPQGRKLEPLVTFAAADGRYCREFALRGKGGGQSGIACRGKSEWTIEALVKGAAELSVPGEIQTAGGADGSNLDAVYARLGASDPLDQSKESELISDRWKK